MCNFENVIAATICSGAANASPQDAGTLAGAGKREAKKSALSVPEQDGVRHDLCHARPSDFISYPDNTPVDDRELPIG